MYCDIMRHMYKYSESPYRIYVRVRQSNFSFLQYCNITNIGPRSMETIQQAT